MITGDECGPNFLTIVLRLRESASSEYSTQGQVLNCKCRNLGCSSAEGRSSTTNNRNQGCSFTWD